MENEIVAGQLIAGKYRVEQVLGRGGMGVVMAAMHEQLNQRVALKFLTDNAYQQPEAVARFLREARSAVRIQSEHVARVMDVGTLDSGAPYMVMEYLRGRDLKDVSTRRGPLPISEAVDFVLQACDAVAEAHSLGIIHRDLKPSNLFLTERPDGSPMVKVLDFGISKALHGTEPSQMQMTASAAIMGSPQYMSPEQIRSSKNVDARADVWALGTILHELCAGAPAYVADTVPGLLAMIVADSPPALCAFRPDAPAELEASILRCLQKDRDQRFANVSEFARSIERFASAETRPLVRRIARVLGDNSPTGSASAPTPPFSATVVEHVGQTNGTWTRTGRVSDGGGSRPLHKKLGVQVGAGLGFIALGASGWLFLQPSASESGAGVPAAPAASAAAPVKEPPTPATAKSVSPLAPTTQRPVNDSPAPLAAGAGVGLIRPVLDDEEVTVTQPSTEDDGAETWAAPEAEAPAPKAKRPATSSPRKRPVSSASKPTRPAPVVERQATQSAPPPAPAKKSNTLELFNDTK
jgi:eukaryotic-like serine/threonine-protein kinase